MEQHNCQLISVINLIEPSISAGNHEMVRRADNPAPGDLPAHLDVQRSRLHGRDQQQGRYLHILDRQLVLLII